MISFTCNWLLTALSLTSRKCDSCGTVSSSLLICKIIKIHKELTKYIVNYLKRSSEVIS